MDENGIITGKIPSSGSGIHKTYEESIIRVFKNTGLNAYKNEYFINEAGGITWASSEEEYTNILKQIEDCAEFRRVELLGVIGLGSDKVIVEFIDSNALRMHLLAEATMRNQEYHLNVGNEDGKLSFSGQGVHKTYPESTFRIIDSFHYKQVLDKSNYGIFIRKSDGAIVIPSLASEFTNGYYRNNTYYKYYELLSDIQENSNEYEEVVVLNTIYNEKSNQFFIELIDKDTFDIYTSSSREARLYSRELKLF